MDKSNDDSLHGKRVSIWRAATALVRRLRVDGDDAALSQTRVCVFAAKRDLLVLFGGVLRMRANARRSLVTHKRVVQRKRARLLGEAHDDEDLAGLPPRQKTARVDAWLYRDLDAVADADAELAELDALIELLREALTLGTEAKELLRQRLDGVAIDRSVT
jgi:hypothetical protein